MDGCEVLRRLGPLWKVLNTRALAPRNARARLSKSYVAPRVEPCRQGCQSPKTDFFPRLKPLPKTRTIRSATNPTVSDGWQNVRVALEPRAGPLTLRELEAVTYHAADVTGVKFIKDIQPHGSGVVLRPRSANHLACCGLAAREYRDERLFENSARSAPPMERIDSLRRERSFIKDVPVKG